MALLSEVEIRERLNGLGGWVLDGARITREFVFDDFVGSVRFVESLVGPAESMNHHPDLWISWNKVTVALTSHSEGGLTEKDFDLAKVIGALA